jgi:hypothetical protein
MTERSLWLLQVQTFELQITISSQLPPNQYNNYYYYYYYYYHHHHHHPVAEPECSTLIIAKPTTGHDPEPVPSTTRSPISLRFICNKLLPSLLP